MLRMSLILLVLQRCTAYENIALQKPAWQQHQYIPGDDRFDASNAVDGLKTDFGPGGGQCSQSDNHKQTATWRVDLEGIRSFRRITIYYRTDNAAWGPQNQYSGRFVGFSLYVSNTSDISHGHLCVPDTNYTRDTIPAVLNVTCPVHGQYVIYYNERLQGKIYPPGYSGEAFNELCEVEVYGCPVPGYYGPDCSIPCPNTCRYCHIETGVCQGCKPGYQGHQCELSCSHQYYGELCKETCGNCSDGVACNNVNGTCTNGCDVGVYGDKCKMPCPSSRHGKNCSRTCTNCDTCDRFTGHCTPPCYSGWKGTHCTEKCDGLKYGTGCNKDCGACLDYTQCHHINGTCFDGCDSGYEGELCKTYCSRGIFGKNCDQICSENCHEDPTICNGTTGECKGGCRPGWEGLQCNMECSMKTFGENCSQPCGNCKDLEKCHHVNGTCIEGCDRGFRGLLCNEVCDFGYFGANCEEECSVFCQKSRDCHHVTGYCSTGCKTGWRGNNCFEVDNPLQQTNAEGNWETKFYGVLGAFCATLVLIGVYVVYNIMKRNRTKLDKSQKYRSSNTTKSTKETESRMDDVEKINSGYQELGGLSPSSTYDSIH
ncbi:multiple epidermal growth factor-like domains protein 10 [Ostrea edulis]|uniref:multiple epidermal growth factor-like domains protein 10 n=1 Tax=Ostrea edulis TaxID=37623 RepID=UPI0024AEEE73|nr:multiple epidermal growth factor-like domains protein 10 [Ostrea edulis]